jgi:L-ascorbate metabolism protein UlaG (beta-lactamase superfamily)
VVELDWWQSRPLGSGVHATYVPAEHFSGRGPFDRNRSLWGGFVLETPAGPIYYAGDTGDGPHFGSIRRQFGPMRLSLMPIGAYLPRWFMAPVHIDPAEAVAASLALDSATTLPIHFGAFPLADEGFATPLQALAAALAAAPEMDFRTPAFGEPVVLLDR